LLSFIGFTGTPIEQTDRNTPAIFGKYIDIYDIQRAVEDEATVRIYYEGRLAKLELQENVGDRVPYQVALTHTNLACNIHTSSQRIRLVPAL